MHENAALYLWYRYVRVLKKVTHNMDAIFSEFELSRYQFDLLMQIYLDPGINQKACALLTQVTRGNVAQHIKRLVEMGIVMRSKTGKENCLYLTSAGIDMVERFLEPHDEKVKDLFSEFSSEEIRQFYSLLSKLDRHLEDVTP